ncbi:MAG: cation:dicarboxylase symporter family transporter, partial [Eggerthellaceae bacterium]|nr:cation:dicarboxylase symporter family transporter [Eggerthellaceae bacterium]
MDAAKTCNLASKDSYSAMLSDCRAAMEKLRASEDAIQEYLDRVAGVLNGLVNHLGDGVEVRYAVSTRFKKALLKIEVQGDKYSPADGDVVDMDSIEDAELQPLLRQHKGAVIYGYHAGQNVIRVASPRIRNKTMLGSAMLWGAVLGLALGFLCTLLPDDVRNIIVNDVVVPVNTVVLNLILCVMGPVILISMITAVSALNSVNDLTSMGLKLIGRFAKCILSVMFVGIMVSLLFYDVFGDGGVDMKARDLVNLLLDIFPKDPISPIKDGNTPQLV